MSTKEPEVEECLSCKFFVEPHCKRYPPTVHLMPNNYPQLSSEQPVVPGNPRPMFPVVGKKEWCGEYLKK